MVEVNLANRPASPLLVRNYLRSVAKEEGEVNPKFRGVIVSRMEEHVDSFQRKAILAWLFDREDGFGLLSSNSLTDRELYALYRWLDPMKVDDVWTYSSSFGRELRKICEVAMEAYLEGEE